MLPAALPFLGRYGRLRPYFHARIPRTYGGSTAVAPSARTPVFYGRSRVKLRPYLKNFFAGRTGPRKTADGRARGALQLTPIGYTPVRSRTRERFWAHCSWCEAR